MNPFMKGLNGSLYFVLALGNWMMAGELAQTAAPAESIPGIAWFPGSLDSAFDAARQQHKQVFLFTGVAWDPAVQHLTATILSRSDVRAALNDYICVHIDYDAPGAQKIMGKLSVFDSRSLLPTATIFRSDRAVMVRLIRTEPTPEDWAGVLVAVQGSDKSLQDLLTEVKRPGSNLTVMDWRRLAYHHWLSESDLSPLRELARKCPQELKPEHARLTFLAAFYAAASDSTLYTTHGIPSTDTAELLRGAYGLLLDLDVCAAALDVLTGGVSLPIFLAAKLDTTGVTSEELGRRWLRVMEAAIADERHTDAQRLSALAHELNAAKSLRLGKEATEELSASIESRVSDILNRHQEPAERGLVVSLAAQLYKMLGKSEKQRQLLEAEYGIRPNPNQMFYFADLASKDGKIEAALDWWRRSYEDATGNATRLDFGVNYVQKLIAAKPEAADLIRETALSVLGGLSGPEDVYWHTRAKLKSLESSLNKWNAGFRHDEDCRRVRARIAELQRLGALDEMRIYGVPDPGKDPSVLNDLGYRALYAENDPKMAVRIFQWNLALFPNYSADLAPSVAEGLLQSGDMEGAISYYSKAVNDRPVIRTGPDAKVVWAKLRTISAASSIDYSNLQSELRAAYLKSEPSVAENLPSAQSSSDEIQKVRDEMRAAGVADPDRNPDTLNQLGYRALYSENNVTKALRYFRWNLVLFPKFAAYLNDSLAEGYLVAGDRDHAIKHYEMALKLDPKIQTKAASFLERLKADPNALSALQAEARNDSAESTARAETQRRVQAEAQKRMSDATKTPVEIKFTAADGREVDTTKLRAKAVLIDFWATWCGPCKEEVPNVVATYSKYHDQGFEVVGISFDRAPNAEKPAKIDKTAEQVLAFTKEHNMPWPQYYDGKYWDNTFGKQYGITAIPAMFLLDQNGMIVSTNARGLKLEQEVRRLLGLPPLETK